MRECNVVDQACRRLKNGFTVVKEEDNARMIQAKQVCQPPLLCELD